MPRTVAIVPHTHWDREWYSPFQTFRLKLVDLLDELLPALEADPSYARFMLDGQMAVVDDYLALRPDAEERLRRLAASGRLSVGPWYVLMDEFCVSGETIVRDLQLGLERAAAFDELLPALEADPSYARFMLDGQMAVVDDYLALRPDAEERLRRLAASGRLSVGPWYVLMDEFCVSGETIVRDLQLGLERAAAFG